MSIVTKNFLVCRDLDVLKKLAERQAAMVLVSITTLDADLTRRMEPRTSVPRRRLEAIGQLRAAGIPVGVMVAPVIPGLTDHEIPGILQAAKAAGTGFAGMSVLRLPHGVAELMENWLEQHFPDRKEKVLGRIRAIRGGKLNDSRFGSRMRGTGKWAEQIKQLFDVAKRKAGFERGFPELSTAGFVKAGQMELGVREEEPGTRYARPSAC